ARCSESSCLRFSAASSPVESSLWRAPRARRRRSSSSSIFSNAITTDVTHAMPNIPVLIFIYSEQPDTALHQDAWAAAVVLIVFVLLASLAAKALLARSTRKLGR